MISFVTILTALVAICKTLIAAALVFFIGRYLIGKVTGMIEKGKLFPKMDSTVRSFAVNAVKILLTTLLLIMVITILGVPMASVITVLASAGVAVGLALQGALSNLAGGIMLMVFRPFNVGDYVDAAGESGVVKEIALFYTVLTSLDNKIITVPNGALMNANVVNYSKEDLRRVDLAFTCGRDENAAQVCALIKDAVAGTDKVLSDPAEPFVRLGGATNEAMEFIVRVWVKNADYWDVHFDVIDSVTAKLGEAGIKAPAMRIIER